MAAATDGHFMDDLDILECQVCFNHLDGRTPRTLPCNHTFCSKCLYSLGKHGVIKCPTCRATTAPNAYTTVGSLPVNTNIEKVFNHLKKLEKAQNEKVATIEKNYQEKISLLEIENGAICKVCIQYDDRQEATKICTSCTVSLCDQCADYHNKIPAFSTHQLVDKTVEASRECEIHEEPITCFCDECGECLCCVCAADEEHLDHIDSVTDIKTSVSSAEQYLVNSKETLFQNLNRLNVAEAVALMDSHEIQITKASLETLQAALIAKVDETNILLEAVNGYAKHINDTLKTVQDCKQQVKVQIDEVKQLKEMDDFELLEEIHETKANLSNLIEQIEDVLQVEYQKAKFEPAWIVPENSVGLLEISGQRVHTETPEEDSSPGKACDKENKQYRLVLEVQSEYSEVDTEDLVGVVTAPDGSILIADRNKTVVQHMSTEGHLIGTYQPSNTGQKISCVSLSSNKMYIAQKGYPYVTKIELGVTNQRNQFNMKGHTIDYMLALPGDRLISYDEDAKSVFQHHLRHKRKSVTTTVLTELSVKSMKALNIQGNATQAKYLLCQAPTAEEPTYSVCMYNHTWNKLVCIPPAGINRDLTGFTCAEWSPWGTVLVTDEENNCVVEYTKEGEFVKELLTSTVHGINNPSAIASHQNYIWMTELIVGDEETKTCATIKLFKMMHQYWV